MSQATATISAPSPAPTAVEDGTVGAGATRRRDTPPKSMVERVTAIVDCFPGGQATLLLEEVSQRTGLPRSTTHRILEQLIAQDWVEHTPDGYRLGGRATGSASSVGSGTHQLRRAAGPVLQDMVVRTGVVVHLSVLDRSSVVYLDKLGGRMVADVPSQVGNSAPVHATAGGKAILSQLDDRVVRDLVPHPLPRLTERTIATLPTLLMELRQVRQRHGLAFESGEAVEGISCIAAPIRYQHGEMAAVSLCSRTGSARLRRFAPLVVHAARTIETALLWPEDHAPEALGPPSRPVADQPGPWSPETSQRLLALARQRAWL